MKHTYTTAELTELAYNDARRMASREQAHVIKELLAVTKAAWAKRRAEKAASFPAKVSYS